MTAAVVQVRVKQKLTGFLCQLQTAAAFTQFEFVAISVFEIIQFRE